MEKAGILVLYVIAAFCVTAGTSAAAAAVAPAVPSYKTLYDLFISSPEFNASLGLFNYTGMLPLLKDPNTMITCFLPTSNAESILWWDDDEKGRYVWAILLHHCLDGQKAMTLKKLAPAIGEDVRYYPSAFPPFIDDISIEQTESGIFFYGSLGDGGKVVKADIKGGKSIIHLIDNGNQFPAFAPPDTFETVLEFLDDFTPFALEVFSASSYVPFLTDPKRTTDITVFAPRDDAFAALLKQLRITKTQLLNNKALVDLIVAAHVINGSALYTGAMVSYGSPIKLQTMAGPLNATGDLTIFPKRSGPAKVVILSNPFVKAVLDDYDTGGNDLWIDPPRCIGHFVDKVLIPISIKDLSKIK
ncbi:hypothetical protein Vretimale_1698 [Volvox reticuliferus]|uniref:FAS1 domain-containing protein n=1 Tax=Volvox reticuliferus TaxID=1737510 RepID=A0A8J4D4Z5_9CHLO|nr:hypothetical protein Vretifemale_15501 [Volvox reticuliferus]GIL95741.1 hypothetical protein Vretimale_1698 [Volvox reticuliferus]